MSGDDAHGAQQLRRQQAQQQRQQAQPTGGALPLDGLPDDLLGAVVAASSNGAFDSSMRLAGKRLAAAHDANVTKLKLKGSVVGVHDTYNEEERGCGSVSSSKDVSDLTHLVSRCTGLVKLTLRRMTAAEAAAALPPSVQQRLPRLSLTECAEGVYTVLPACTALHHLKVQIDREDGSLLSMLRHVRALTRLRSLNIDAAYARSDWQAASTPVESGPLTDALSGLVGLTQLSVEGFKMFNAGMHIGVQTLASLTSLQELKLWGFLSLHAAALTALVNLRRLDLSRGDAMLGSTQQLAGLSALSALADLRLCGRFVPWSLRFFCQLTQLQSLDLNLAGLLGAGVSGAELLGLLKRLERLERLHLRTILEESLAPLQELRQLRCLKLTSCGTLDSLQFLSGLTRLEELVTDGNPCDIEPLTGLTRLRVLEVHNLCRRVDDLAPLRSLTCLERLSLSNFRKVNSLDPLSGLVQLTSLYLSGNRVSSLAPISALTRLQQLRLITCGTVSGLEPLQGLVRLQELQIAACHVTSLLPLRELRSLQELDVVNCNKLTLASFEPLQQLVQANKLRIYPHWDPQREADEMLDDDDDEEW